MFEKVTRSLKYDSNFFRPQTYIYIYIYMDTMVDHFTLLALRVQGKNEVQCRDDVPAKRKVGGMWGY